MTWLVEARLNLQVYQSFILRLKWNSWEVFYLFHFNLSESFSTSIFNKVCSRWMTVIHFQSQITSEIIFKIFWKIWWHKQQLCNEFTVEKLSKNKILPFDKKKILSFLSEIFLKFHNKMMVAEKCWWHNFLKSILLALRFSLNHYLKVS